MRRVAALLVLTALACRPAASAAPARPATPTPSSPPAPVAPPPAGPMIPGIDRVCATTVDGRINLTPSDWCGCGVEVTCKITRHRDIVNLTVRYASEEEAKRVLCLECWPSRSDGCATDPLPPNTPVRIAVAGYYFDTLTTDDRGLFADDACVKGKIP